MRVLLQRAAGVVTGLLGLLLLGGLVIGVPVLLIVTVGWPLPRSLPSWDQITTFLQTQGIDDTLVLRVVAIALWILWAYLLAGLIAQALAGLRGARSGRRSIVAPSQRVAQLLIGLVLLGLTLTLRPPTPRAIAGIHRSPVLRGVPVAAPLHPRLPASVMDSGTRAPTPLPPPSRSAQAAATTTQVVHVRPGDSLWRIADREYGDPSEWTRIWDANQGQTEDDGEVFNDPSLIEPGWQLRVPDVPVTPASSTPTAPTAFAPPAAGPPQEFPATRTDQQVQVLPGDSLWGIAQREYGDPSEWMRIWDANQGQTEGDGEAITDPSLIEPGWELTVPALNPMLTTLPPAAVAPHVPPDVAGQTQPAETVLPAVSPTPRLPMSSPAAAGSQGSAGERSARDHNPSAAVSSWAVTLAEDGTIPGLAAAALVGLLLAAQRHERRRRRPGDGTGSRVALLAQRPNMRRIRAAISAVMPGGGAQRDVAAHVTEPALRARLESVEAVPGRVVVGERKGDGGDAMVDIDELHGLVLTGPGAEAAARAIVISFLAHHSWDAAQVMVATTLAPTLLSTTEGIPGLRVLGMDLLLDRLEAEIRYQREALEQGGQINWRQRLGGPDPLPASLAVIISDGVSPANLDRLATDLEAARDLAVAVLVLGTRPGPLWPEPVEVDSEGGLDAVGTACLGGAACVHMLTRQEADELLAVIAAGRGRETVPVLTDGERDQLTSLARPPSGSGSGVGHITSVAVSSGSPVAVDGTKPPRAVRRVDIRVYGRVRIIVDGREMRELTESGRQVLALLAVCGELSEAQAMLALGGGSDDPVRASRFTVAVRATRASLRDTLGLDANPIVSAGGVFRLNRDLVSSDHERLVAGSEAARHIDDPHRRQELLASATDGLNGEPFAGAEWNWLVDHQERVRNVAVDALTDLAQLEADSDDLEAALETLDRALAVAADPVEAIFQKQILWQYRLGRKDAARDRYRELARQLAVRCDRSPSEETEALMESLRAAPRVVGQ